MNSRQTKVLIGGAALVAVMLLFPPWEYFDGDSSMRRQAGYHFVLTPPPLNDARRIFQPEKIRYPGAVRVRLNTDLLLLQLLAVAPATLGTMLLVRTTRNVIAIALGILLICLAIPPLLLWFLFRS